MSGLILFCGPFRRALSSVPEAVTPAALALTSILRRDRIAQSMFGLLVAGVLSCSSGNTSDRVGIASECAIDTDCPTVDNLKLSCLTVFKGGYCGLQGCTQDADCPQGAACIVEGGANYCFRECVDKPECNLNRSVINEANCVGSATHVGVSTAKVCVPPSGT